MEGRNEQCPIDRGGEMIRPKGAIKSSSESQHPSVPTDKGERLLKGCRKQNFRCEKRT